MTYQAETFNTMLERIADGESVKSICEEDGMPSQQTFYRWIRENAEQCEKYTRAKEFWADAQLEEIVNISDESTNDIIFNEQGKPIINGDAIQRARLRIDTRKWCMGRLNPKKYGDKMAVGNADDKPFETKDVTDPAEASRKLAAMMAIIAARKGSNES
jgi:hypothetical protein